MALFDDVTKVIECPCGTQHEKTVKWLRTHGEFNCECGAVISIEGTFGNDMKRADKVIDDFRKNIRRINRHR